MAFGDSALNFEVVYHVLDPDYNLSILLTWKVLFFEQDCQTGQDCMARNRFVLRNRPSLPVWLRPSGRAVDIQQQINLTLVRKLDELMVSFALPSRTLYVEGTRVPLRTQVQLLEGGRGERPDDAEGDRIGQTHSP